MNTQKRVILNADDFGMKELIDRAILDAYDRGFLSSASLVPNGKRFDQAVSAAKQVDLPVGIHLGLILENTVCADSEVSSLINSQGKLPRNYKQFILNFISGNFCFDELKKEIRAQFEKVRKTDLNITHVDSHQHLHVLPGIFNWVIQCTQDFNIPAVRIPDQLILKLPQWINPKLIALKGFAKYSRKNLPANGPQSSDSYDGFFLNDHLSRKRIKSILPNLHDGTTEISLHLAVSPVEDPYRFPMKDSFCNTYEQLLSGKLHESLRSKGIQKITYRDLM